MSYRNVVAKPMEAVGEFFALTLETVIAASSEAPGPVYARDVRSVERARAAL